MIKKTQVATWICNSLIELPTYDACPKYDVKLVIGDLNAQIGKEAIYYPTIGKEAFHQERNENGKRLIHFTASRNMVIGSTLL
jgi:hypothetical protein